MQTVYGKRLVLRDFRNNSCNATGWRHDTTFFGWRARHPLNDIPFGRHHPSSWLRGRDAYGHAPCASRRENRYRALQWFRIIILAAIIILASIIQFTGAIAMLMLCLRQCAATFNSGNLDRSENSFFSFWCFELNAPTFPSQNNRHAVSSRHTV